MSRFSNSKLSTQQPRRIGTRSKSGFQSAAKLFTRMATSLSIHPSLFSVKISVGSRACTFNFTVAQHISFFLHLTSPTYQPWNRFQKKPLTVPSPIAETHGNPRRDNQQNTYTLPGPWRKEGIPRLESQSSAGERLGIHT